MKKSFLALAVLGAFAGSAMAADVTLYGLVDYGFSYQNRDGDGTQDTVDQFQMKAGQNSGSRFGFKGTEDLGNGMKVSFVLENGFDADTGSLTTNGKIFDREASLTLAGNFGQVSFGRMGQLASSLGTYGLLGAASPFSTGWGDMSGMKFVQANGHTRYNNMVTYKTPSFSGFNVVAQYSFGDSGESTDKAHSWAEGKASADRYYGLGMTYKNDALYLAAIVDSINYGHEQHTASKTNLDDSLTFTVAGNYNFGFMTVYAAGQYFDNVTGVGQKGLGDTGSGSIAAVNQFAANGGEGYSVALGLGVPVFGGTAKAHVGYVDAEDTVESKNTFSRWNMTVGYDYSLSKRTSVYTAATYAQDKYEYADTAKADVEPSVVEVMAGLIHKF